MANLQEMFTAFAKFGDSKSDGKVITLTQSDKWMKQANVIGKQITTTDTGICFGKLKQKSVNIKDYQTFLQDLAKYKNTSYDEIVKKLTGCGTPGTTGATKTTNVGGVDRLTDTSKYTGTHKERFDAEGKGKGKAGRSDAKEDTGYVTGYKEKDTYDKKH